MNLNQPQTQSKFLLALCLLFLISFSGGVFANSSLLLKSNFNPLIQNGNQNQMTNANDASINQNDLYHNSFNPPDPFESFNKPIFEFNLWLDENLLLPLAKGYKKITPEAVDDSVTHFFANLANITSSANFLLQGEIEKSANTVVRFVGNSIFGIFGLFDIATDAGIPQDKTNFNQTLKKWQVASGPYIVLPIFGPNTPRTVVGRFADYYTDPINTLDNTTFLRVLGLIDFRADNQGLFEMAKNASFDPYDSMRLFFLKKEIKKEQEIDLDDYADFEPLE